MSKNVIDRINETLDQIEKNRWQSLFPGLNTSVVRKILLGRVRDHYSPAEIQNLSNLLSLGDRGLTTALSSEETHTRHLKRMILLFHKVLGYHTDAETESVKRTILKMDRAGALQVGSSIVRRGIDFIQNEQLWARELSQRYGGQFRHYYNQGKDPRLKEIDITENGWCLGMSVQWLGCRATMQEFWQHHEGPEAAGRYRFVMAGQKVRTAGTGSTTDRAAFRLKRFRMDQVKVTKEKANPTGARMARILAESAEPFCRIGQYYKSGGGHAMAADKSRSDMTFMDPNLGEFQFSSIDNFERWFPLFTQRMNYVFSEYYVEQYRYNPGNTVPVGIKDAMAKRRAALGVEEDDVW